MTIKRVLSVVAVLCAVGIASGFAQAGPNGKANGNLSSSSSQKPPAQDTQKPSQGTWSNSVTGNECFSLNGVDAEPYPSYGYTMISNNNNYRVTVVYTVNGQTRSTVVSAKKSHRVDGIISLVSCLPQ
jgi:hypothetical protein